MLTLMLMLMLMLSYVNTCTSVVVWADGLNWGPTLGGLHELTLGFGWDPECSLALGLWVLSTLHASEFLLLSFFVGLVWQC
jgi:hypothetical protein